MIDWKNGRWYRTTSIDCWVFECSNSVVLLLCVTGCVLFVSAILRINRSVGFGRGQSMRKSLCCWFSVCGYRYTLHRCATSVDLLGDDGVARSFLFGCTVDGVGAPSGEWSGSWRSGVQSSAHYYRICLVYEKVQVSCKPSLKDHLEYNVTLLPIGQWW